MSSGPRHSSPRLTHVDPAEWRVGLSWLLLAWTSRWMPRFRDLSGNFNLLFLEEPQTSYGQLVRPGAEPVMRGYGQTRTQPILQKLWRRNRGKRNTPLGSRLFWIRRTVESSGIHHGGLRTVSSPLDHATQSATHTTPSS